ncbi:hypothetical protein AAIA72_14965 [Hahella sp. SMD15-11]|uniref:Uncharacterized protein n=1 Tax=Thermohahella caldifontis TaxID=3142973 RepID=A0AB39UVL2_9GAMM
MGGVVSPAAVVVVAQAVADAIVGVGVGAVTGDGFGEPVQGVVGVGGVALLQDEVVGVPGVGELLQQLAGGVGDLQAGEPLQAVVLVFDPGAAGQLQGLGAIPEVGTVQEGALAFDAEAVRLAVGGPGVFGDAAGPLRKKISLIIKEQLWR